MKKILLSILSLISIMTYAQTETLNLEKGETGIIIPETEEFYIGSRLTIHTNEGNVAGVLEDARRSFLSVPIKEVIEARPVDPCKALNSMTTIFAFYCYFGSINQVSSLGGAIQIQCLQSDRICFIGVSSPL